MVKYILGGQFWVASGQMKSLAQNKSTYFQQCLTFLLVFALVKTKDNENEHLHLFRHVTYIILYS
jgi:hypothetical protein